jgi:branched-chain amino acid transport system ATP-binding protein
LAYGEQRLVEIAIALGQQPTVLLLDEPTAGVPGAESRRLLDVIEGLSDNISIVFIEHDMELVFRFAQRITVMVTGRILTEGTPQEIANNAQVQAVYLGDTHG